jgi:hypothetical protein
MDTLETYHPPVVSEMIALKVEYDSLLDVMAGKVRSVQRWDM